MWLKTKSCGFGQSPSFAKVFAKLFACSVLIAVGACTTTGAGKTTGSNALQAQQPEMTGAQQTLFRAGEEAENEHKYDVAANAYGRLFERRNNDPKILTAFIRTMRYSNRSREIIDYVDSKTQHLFGDPNVKFEYAKALIAAGHKTEATSVLREVSQLLPGNWQVVSAMGIAFDSMGAFPQAIASYKEALRLSPNNVVVMNNMAMSQAMMGQLSLAISTLEGAATINRSNTHVRQNLALLYAVRGDVDKARALAAMDLNAGDLETNLSFYRRFEGAAQ